MVKYKFKLIKIFISILALIISFQSWTKADDVRDFEIDGMSVGDSLLDHFEKKKVKKLFNIKNAINFYPNIKKFITLGTSIKSANYQNIYFGLRNKDKNYVIYSIEGYNRMDYQKCLNKIDLVSLDIEGMFSNNTYSKTVSKGIHDTDKSKNTIYISHDFNFKSGSSIRVICIDWGKEMESINHHDSFMISLQSKEFDYWLNNEAY